MQSDQTRPKSERVGRARHVRQSAPRLVVTYLLAATALAAVGCGSNVATATSDNTDPASFDSQPQAGTDEVIPAVAAVTSEQKHRSRLLPARQRVRHRRSVPK
jgi:hypothetical protein